MVLLALCMFGVMPLLWKALLFMVLLCQRFVGDACTAPIALLSSQVKQGLYRCSMRSSARLRLLAGHLLCLWQ